MPTRFRRTIKLLPGVRLNIGKTGITSISAGPRGATITIGRRGVHGNVGLPGTGLSYRTKLFDTKSLRGAGGSSKKRRRANSPDAVVPALEDDDSLVLLDEDGEPLPDADARAQRSEHRDQLIALLDDTAARRNRERANLIALHTATPAPQPPSTITLPDFDWPKPGRGSDRQVPTAPPTPPALEEPTGFAASFAPMRDRIERENREKQEHYEQALAEWETRQARGALDYDDALKAWQAARKAHDESTAARKQLLADGFKDTGAMDAYLGDVLASLDWPRETLVDFQLDGSGTTVWVDVDLPPTDDFPTATYTTNRRSLKLTARPISATQQRKDYAVHVHAVLFRIAGEVFATLPPVESVVISGYAQQIDKATGHMVDTYLVSAWVTRAAWQSLNFANLDDIDVTLAFEQFELRRKMSKTGIFKPIQPFTPNADGSPLSVLGTA